MRNNRSLPSHPVGPPAYPGPAWDSRTWPGQPRRSLAARLGRLLLRRRRLFAALLLCVAASIAVQQLTPARPPSTPVLVAARDLPAGHVLAAGDVQTAAVSPDMVPDGALGGGTGGSPGAADPVPAPAGAATGIPVAGAQLSGPVRRGEVLTDASLLGEGLLAGAPPGSQAVPLRLSDPSTLSLLRQGQLVTVVLSSSGGIDGPAANQVLAEKVPVLWTPALAPTGGGLVPAPQDTDAVVVVAALPGQAVQLAGAINRGKVFLILLN